MIDDKNYETYLLISSKRLIISVNKFSNEKIYFNELKLDKFSNEIIFDVLDNFLHENVFKIEKILNDFVKNIFVIFDVENFFSIGLSIKKNNSDDVINSKNLSYLLYEAKDYCKKTTVQKQIIHMIIDNFKVDNNNYAYLPPETNNKSLSLDLKFICISENILKKLEKVLNKYQIALSQIVSANYVKNFFIQDKGDIFEMSRKIINGCNPNEVGLVDKIKQNKGFFEKFFNFFN